MKRILIVDDDVTFALMLRTWLSKRGFDAETATSVGAARKALEANDFALVLSDMRLPDEDGTALLLQPGSLDLPAVPGVTLTAAGFLENRLRLQLRFDGHSPYDQEALTLTAPDGTAYRACAFLYTQAEEGTVYRDAVYDVTPEALTDCVLSGRFATGGQLLQGDWQVTFRLDS